MLTLQLELDGELLGLLLAFYLEVELLVALLVSYNELTTAHSLQCETEQTFQITHPFHPLFQQEYEVVDVRHVWGMRRVYYYDVHGKLKALPASWTSLEPPDPFVICAKGRSPFRIQDLIELSSLLKELSSALKERKNV